MADSPAEVREALLDLFDAVQRAGSPAVSYFAPGLPEDHVRDALAAEQMTANDTLLVVYSLQNGYRDRISRRLAHLAPIGLEGLGLDEAIDGYRFFRKLERLDLPSHPGWFPVFWSPNGYLLMNTVDGDEHPVGAVRFYDDEGVDDVCDSFTRMVGWWTGFIRAGLWFWVAEQQSWDSSLTWNDLTDEQQRCLGSY